MEDNTSSISRQYHYDCDKLSKFMPSIVPFLPDNVMEMILACLPIASIFRAGCVCKRWHKIVTSKRFVRHSMCAISRKPWYFMFTSTADPFGYTYDPTLPKWYSLELSHFITRKSSISSSFGLVCFMNMDSKIDFYVYNPITRRRRRLVEPPRLKRNDDIAIAISADRVSQSYKISIVRTRARRGGFSRWCFSIHVYDSETMTWSSSVTEELNEWRVGDQSVICDGFLYFLIYSTPVDVLEQHHGLVRYNLSSCSTDDLLTNHIPIPFPLTCRRLMNLNEKLVMVGGIGKEDRPDKIEGIGIWALDRTEWEVFSLMPREMFLEFGQFESVFASAGTGDIIYIHSYGGIAMVVFDMNEKQWKWSEKRPVANRFPLSGFCFEPRLDITP